MTPEITLNGDDLARIEAINAAIPGWSGQRQYAFFKGVLQVRPELRTVLMLGVYQGRDLAYLLDIAARYHADRPLTFCGVDKFSDTPCADWPDGKRPLDWKAAGFGEAPSLARALENLRPFRLPDAPRMVILRQKDDASYLVESHTRFDFAYLDTAHDFETVQRQLRQVLRVTKPGAIIAGDDYSDAGTWGVKRAVAAGTRRHAVFANWIWHCAREDVIAEK